MSSEQTTNPDLHGIEKQPFPSFDEDTTYLERVTVPEARDAEQLIADEFNRAPGEVEVEPIHMHWLGNVDEAEAKAVPTAWFTEPGWYECFDASPGALPFWREVVEEMNYEERCKELQHEADTARADWLHAAGRCKELEKELAAALATHSPGEKGEPRCGGKPGVPKLVEVPGVDEPWPMQAPCQGCPDCKDVEGDDTTK